MRPRARAATRRLFLPYAIGSRVRRAIPARRTWLYIRAVGGRGGRVGMVGWVFWEGRAVPVGRILRAPPAFGVSGLLLAGRCQGILRPTFATPTSDEGYQGGPIYISRRTRRRAAWPLGGRALRRISLVIWPRNSPLGCPMARFMRACASRRSGNYRMSSASPHASGRVVAPASPLGMAPICSAIPAGVARGLRDMRWLTDWDARTGLSRRGARSALFY